MLIFFDFFLFVTCSIHTVVPGFCISIVLSGVLLGLKKVATNAVPTVIFAVLDVITVYIIVNVVKVDNLVPLAFGVVIMRYGSTVSPIRN
jgi:hypothetical protein